MEKTLKAAKYMLNDYKKGLVIFYGVMTGLMALAVYSTLRLLSEATGDITVGGFDSATVVFMFIAAMNSFKVNFKFLQANNVSRKTFFKAASIVFLSVSVFMALIEASANKLLTLIIPYQGTVRQLYNTDSFAANLTWALALTFLAASMGWFITILYYNCSKVMKTLVSLSPVFLVILITLLNRLTGGAVSEAIVDFFTVILGFSSSNPYIAVISYLISAVVFMALSYMLIRRVPIKD